MGKPTYDFGGWATRNDLKCSDGRTIRHNAFKDCDGVTVPLVWNHAHGEPENVLGRALLKNKDEGVYCYGTFNDTSAGQVAKTLVMHGDISSLSIYANQLKQVGGDVLHGAIREVSLVHAGANPGAFIDTIIAHSDDMDEEAIIYTGENIFLEHADKEDAGDPEKKENKEMAKEEKTVQDVFDELTEEQKTVVYALIGKALEENGGADDDEDEGDDDMKHNVFDNDYEDNTLIHAAMDTIITDGKRFGSMKESFLQHAEEYGIDQIDWLMPEYQSVTGNAPQFIKTKPDGWVQKIMNGVHHTPFSRIKMMFADITADEARAKGYIKGTYKKEEVFGLLKRTVDPTTVYKKQKMDRDDVIDITDFDVISWLKGEMRMKLDEELARAYVFGDGRSPISDDKISETNIIPICADADLYTIKHDIEVADGETFEHAFVNAALVAQDEYDGSGNITAFIPVKSVTRMLLMEDVNGRRIYNNVSDLANAMGVSEIVKVPANIVPEDVAAVLVDLSDYNVGADKGGAVNMFDDFDIDYNQQKYLIETRCSGALTKPYSAIVLKNAG